MRLRLLAAALFLVNLVSGQDEKSHCTSIAGMTNLLHLEAQLIDNLSNYADELENKLLTVRGYVTEMRAASRKAQQDSVAHLSNPLNSFSLIRRMHEDWIHWQKYMKQPVGQQQVKYLNEQREQLPSSTDLQEAAEALYRIHVTYDLKISDMAKGLLNGRQYNVSLSALDSYALGKFLYDQQIFEDAGNWIYQAINWLQNKQNVLALPLQLDQAELLQVYAEALIKLKRYADAQKVLQTATTLKKDSFKLLIRKSEVETLIRTEPNAVPKLIKKRVGGKYEKGCRGQYAPATSSRLHCVYNSTNSAFLRLAPLKMELLQLDPYMVLYHDAISPREIEDLQFLAMPRLKRAKVVDQVTHRNMMVKERTSKVTWLGDATNAFTMRLNKRIEDMSGFTMYGSEMLQVMNYGLGGHYASHYDFLNATSKTRLNGDRIATVMFYLSDVEQGGATVFPKIQKAVFPQRGTAIIWYNLKENGDFDTNTIHAACPVIVGSKWVCNKWIRENEQMFRRPCLKQ
ncbi:GH14105 [Drosophila grimshawi]|uniref:procollagen-proline 4-dioxygenase n=1 Tax=Drosophila grimshawi TaxID=7222 RepID=B4JY15_DROGR|nr:GH14105 [Drosophila grimshawi]